MVRRPLLFGVVDEKFRLVPVVITICLLQFHAFIDFIHPEHDAGVRKQNCLVPDCNDTERMQQVVVGVAHAVEGIN